LDEGNLQRLCIPRISHRVHLCFELVSVSDILETSPRRSGSFLSRRAKFADSQQLMATNGDFERHSPDTRPEHPATMKTTALARHAQPGLEEKR
jgi:hypothetical protein